MKKLFLILFILTGLIFNTNNAFALKKKDVPRVLNKIVQEKFPEQEKKEKILNRKIIKNFISKFNSIYMNSFVYSNILQKKYYDNYTILKKTDGQEQFSFNINRLSILNNSYKENLKEKIRMDLIKELFKRNIIKFDDEIHNFYIDTNLKGELTVKQLKKSNKKDLISIYLDNMFNKEILTLRPLNNDSIILLDKSNYNNVNKVIYYNYLFNNNLKKEINLDLDLNIFKNTLILRNEEDFKKLFKVTSYRYRSGYRYDPEYRKYNIKQIYDTIPGNKMVLYPKQTISFNQIYLKNDNGTKFKKGSIIMDGKAKKGVYGGGVCGAATGMYQGTIWNKYIKTNAIPHSIWYNMYRASINGKKIYTPGLDATYFTNVIDLKITNTGEYPIIFINRIVNNIEENFTLSTTFVKDDKIKNLYFNYRSNLNQDDEKKKRSCFVWTINGKTKWRCYKKIASEEKAKELEKKKKKEEKKEN